METHIGTKAYMDPNVQKGGYDKSVDIYSMALVFLYIFRGVGLFDHLKDIYEYNNYKNKLYSNYEANMEK
jgi:serine/threonine protein kinase